MPLAFPVPLPIMSRSLLPVVALASLTRPVPRAGASLYGAAFRGGLASRAGRVSLSPDAGAAGGSGGTGGTATGSGSSDGGSATGARGDRDGRGRRDRSSGSERGDREPSRRPKTDYASAARIIDSQYGGNAERAVADLTDQRDRARHKLRTLDDAGVDVPPGGRVLTKAEADAFDAFTKLGTPADVTARLTKAADDRQWRETQEAAEGIGRIAKAHGYDADTVRELATLGRFKVEVRKVPERQQDGTTKDVDVVHAVRAGADGEDVAEPLESFAKATYPALSRVLRTSATADTGNGYGTGGTGNGANSYGAPANGGNGAAGGTGGVSWPDQNGTDRSAGAGTGQRSASASVLARYGPSKPPAK